MNLRSHVVERMGDPSAVLVVDETGDMKKGAATVGVQRQYTGTAGRIENSQVAVYLNVLLLWRSTHPRGWASWQRWTLPAMLAHVLLSVLTATQSRALAVTDQAATLLRRRRDNTLKEPEAKLQPRARNQAERGGPLITAPTRTMIPPILSLRLHRGEGVSLENGE
jgi:hypothetical protein